MLCNATLYMRPGPVGYYAVKLFIISNKMFLLGPGIETGSYVSGICPGKYFPPMIIYMPIDLKGTFNHELLIHQFELTLSNDNGLFVFYLLLSFYIIW